MPEPSATNNLQFTKMGLQLGQYAGPWGMAAGAVAGFGADLLMGRDNAGKYSGALAKQGAENFEQTHFNPYANGYNQGQGGFRFGGPDDAPVRRLTVLPMADRSQSLPKKTPVGVPSPLPRPYEFRSTPDRNRAEQEEIERQRLRQVRDAYRASLQFALGGPTVSRHIVPENMVMEAVQRNDDMSIVPGMGTGTEDNIQMGGIRVSSGEGVMSDEAMREAAFNQGIAYSDFMMRNYPNTTKLLRRTGHFAYGGPAKDRQDYDLARARELGYSPDGMGHMPSRDYLTGRILKEPFHPTFRTGIEEDRKLGYNPMIGTDGKVYTVSPNDIPSEGPFAQPGFFRGGPDGGPNIVKSTVSSGDVLGPMLIPYDFSELGYMPNEDNSVMPDISARSEKSGSDQGFDMEGFDKMNNATAIAGGVLGLGSALYNAFQKRSIPPPPEEYKPQLLDLKTGAFANALEDRRKGAQVTGLYNFRGRQSLGSELGVLSAGLRQRNADAAAVEQVKNRQEEYNNQLINNAELGNMQRRDAYNQAQGEAQDRFRAMKGAAVSAGLNTMINAGSQWMQNRMVADVAAKQAGVYGAYSLWQSGKTDKSLDELLNEAYQFNPTRRSR